MTKIQKVALVMCLMFVAAVAARAQEKKAKLSDFPAVVQAAAKEQSKGATVRGYAVETEHGKTLYEVELKANGLGKDITLDSAGAVMEVEEEVALANVPAAAKAGIEKGAGKGKILKVEAVKNGNGELQAYEAAVLKAGKHSEVRVGPDGNPKPEED